MLKTAKFASGPIALQFGTARRDAPGGIIKFRKVAIRAL